MYHGGKPEQAKGVVATHNGTQVYIYALDRMYSGLLQINLRPIKDRRASLRDVLVLLCEMHISESCSLVSLFVIDPAVVE